MRQPTGGLLDRPAPVPEIEIDEELFEEGFDMQALAGLTAELDDVEPWQRLGDILGQVTGEAEAE